MEFFKFHATIYVQHVLYTLENIWFSSTKKKKFSLDFVEFSHRALYSSGHPLFFRTGRKKTK